VLITLRTIALTLLAAASIARAQVGPDGWTQFTPSPDSRIVYVSTSGSPGNSGLSASSPLNSLAAGFALLRDGYPDWLLLRSGDTFSDVFPNWNKAGRSASEPMRVGVYGGQDRATLLCGTSTGLGGYTAGNTPRSHLAFTDLAFVASGYDGANAPTSGISFMASWSDVLLENISVSGFYDDVVFQCDATQETMADIRLRRCVITDAYTTGGAHSQGAYLAGINRLLLEDCVFDHNGWNESVAGAVPDMYRHNIYIQWDCSNVTVRGIVSARAAATGMQQRPGGLCENSLFINNPISLVFGGAADSNVRDCSVVGSRDISAAATRGWGFNLVNTTFHLTATRCLTLGGPLMGTANVIGFGIDTAPNVTLQNCASWHWQSAAGVGVPVWAANAPFPTVVGGDMEQTAPSHAVTVEAYMSSLGQTPSADAFLAEARRQSRALWRPQYTAGAFNTWAQQAFGLGTQSCYANCDGSTAAPLLNVADFTCFLTRFSSGDPWANCDASTQAPVLNVQDFSCFLQRYSAGCH
jgi:hypothetical protein